MAVSIHQLVQRHFSAQAATFDRLYGAGADGESLVQHVLRPALFTRRDAAVALVRERPGASVFDIGCGSGRVAELMLEAGAGRYVGVDFSAPMIELSAARLAPFADKVRLITGDFLAAAVDSEFDVVTALGFFDYIEDPAPFVRKMAALCRGVSIATFPRWDWFKGPIRHFRYERLNDCPIYDFSPREVRFLFAAAGFARVELDVRRSGILVRAYRQ